MLKPADNSRIPWGSVAAVLTLDPTMLQQPMERVCLIVMDQLRQHEGPMARDLLNFWQSLAGKAGVSEKQLRLQRDEELRASRQDLVGCSWFKCPLYGHNVECMEVFSCARCRKAGYCGPECQKR